MATTSRVPAAIDALLAVLEAAPELDGVAIVDGPPTTDLTKLDQLFVGWQPENMVGVQLTQDFAGASTRIRDESFEIGCYVESRSGDTDMKARRDRVFGLVAVVEQVLRGTEANPDAASLGGAVLWSHLTAGDLRQVQSADGALAGVDFTVTCRARI
jgi:hypothetical protein